MAGNLARTSHRRSIRLKGYDYARAGAYFITARTQGSACLFGDIVGEEMCLNDSGRIVVAAWNDLPAHYAGIVLDEFVVMPNHIHAIVTIVANTAGAGLTPPPAPCESAPAVSPRLSEIVRACKTFSARRINASRGEASTSVWQRNYYEHIIRDDESLNRIRQYIIDNPAQWAMDHENPANAGANGNYNRVAGANSGDGGAEGQSPRRGKSV
jgi:REP element-mobilizing transposase RayT